MNRQQRVAHAVALVVMGVGVIGRTIFAQECPELVGLWPYGPSWAVTGPGSRAYFGSGSLLKVAEASNPSAPLVVGSVALPEEAQDIVVAGSYAYVADGNSGLRVIDVSDPSDPTEVAFVDTPGFAWRLAVSGGYAYIAACEDGFYLIDVSEPTAPVQVGFFPTPDVGWDVAVAGAYAYVSDANSLRVIDVSTPSTPVEVGFIEGGGTGQGAGRVAVSGGYAYVAGYVADVGAGLWVLDVSTPSAPVEAGFFPTPDWASDVANSGGYVFLAANFDGLYVFRECGLVFEDGFDSGDTSNWSATVP